MKKREGELEAFTVSYSDLINDVTIIQCLGEGAYGRAELVQYRGKRACMKTINISNECDASPQSSCLREAGVLFDLKGAGGAPNLYAVAKDKPVIIMEFCLGVTLHDFLSTDHGKNHPTKYSVLMNIAHNIIELHDKKYRHGDISQLNVMVCDDGQGKDRFRTRIIDYGLAKYDDGREDDGDVLYDDEVDLLNLTCDILDGVIAGDHLKPLMLQDRAMAEVKKDERKTCLECVVKIVNKLILKCRRKDEKYRKTEARKQTMEEGQQKIKSEVRNKQIMMYRKQKIYVQ